MATFKRAKTEKRDILVNIDLVRFMEQIGERTALHFTDGSKIFVEESPETIASLKPVAWSER